MLKALSTILFSVLVLVVGTLHTMGPVGLARLVERLSSAETSVAVMQSQVDRRADAPAARLASSVPALSEVFSDTAPSSIPQLPTIRFADASIGPEAGACDRLFEWSEAPVCAEGPCTAAPRVVVLRSAERQALRGALEEADRVRRRAILETVRARLLAGDADFRAAVTGAAHDAMLALPEGISAVTAPSTVVR